MRFSFVILLVVALVSAAPAQDQMGISAFADHVDGQVAATPLTIGSFHVVLVDPSSAFIGGYECRLELDDDSVMLLSVTGPGDWANYGASHSNHIVGFGTPLPATAVTVLSTIDFFVLEDPALSRIFMGPSDPSSFDGAGPGYADGEDPTQLVPCGYTVPGGDGYVGEIVTAPVPVVSRSFSEIKALFR